jgi:hypothetical protein
MTNVTLRRYANVRGLGFKDFKDSSDFSTGASYATYIDALFGRYRHLYVLEYEVDISAVPSHITLHKRMLQGIRRDRRGKGLSVYGVLGFISIRRSATSMQVIYFIDPLRVTEARSYLTARYTAVCGMIPQIHNTDCSLNPDHPGYTGMISEHDVEAVSKIVSVALDHIRSRASGDGRTMSRGRLPVLRRVALVAQGGSDA